MKGDSAGPDSNRESKRHGYRSAFEQALQSGHSDPDEYARAACDTDCGPYGDRHAVIYREPHRRPWRKPVTSEYGALVGLLRANAWLRDPNPERSRVTGLEHALQAATRAERDGATPDEIVLALVHDAARPLSDAHHGRVIAEVMRGRLPLPMLQVLRHHGLFQADELAGTRYAWGLYGDASWYPLAVRLAAWDSAAFDPEYPAEPLERFLPLLQWVMER